MLPNYIKQLVDMVGDGGRRQCGTYHLSRREICYYAGGSFSLCTLTEQAERHFLNVVQDCPEFSAIVTFKDKNFIVSYRLEPHGEVVSTTLPYH